MSSCCKEGFMWNGEPISIPLFCREHLPLTKIRTGKPKGKETTLGKNDCYVVGDNKDVAILMIADVFGWALPNARLLADHFAKDIDATVYLPD